MERDELMKNLVIDLPNTILSSMGFFFHILLMVMFLFSYNVALSNSLIEWQPVYVIMLCLTLIFLFKFTPSPVLHYKSREKNK